MTMINFRWFMEMCFLLLCLPVLSVVAVFQRPLRGEKIHHTAVETCVCVCGGGEGHSVWSDRKDVCNCKSDHAPRSPSARNGT